MARILLVGDRPAALHEFASGLSNNGNLVGWASSGQEALAIIGREPIDTVIVDEKTRDGDGLDFVRILMRMHPLINSAVISSLPMADFHEATEGLGVFMQLPVRPGVEHAEKLLQLLETVDVLMNL